MYTKYEVSMSNPVPRGGNDANNANNTKDADANDDRQCMFV